MIEWQNLLASIRVTGIHPSKLEFLYVGEKGQLRKVFTDSFSCFKRSIEVFVEQIHKTENLIPREETLELVSILEAGR